MNWEPEGRSNWEISSLEELERILQLGVVEACVFEDMNWGENNEYFNDDLTHSWVWDSWNYVYWKINRKLRVYLKTQKLRLLK